MIRRIAKKSVALFVLGLFLAGGAFAAKPLPTDTQSQVSSENWKAIQTGSAKLERLQEVSGKLNLAGESLDLMARTPSKSREIHALHLNTARTHLNEAGRLLAELQDIYPGLAPWQQQAIDTITPIAAQVAESTRAAILHLNNHPLATFVPVYTDHLRTIAAQSLSMKETVDNFLDYADAQGKVQALETALEIDRS